MRRVVWVCKSEILAPSDLHEFFDPEHPASTLWTSVFSFVKMMLLVGIDEPNRTSWEGRVHCLSSPRSRSTWNVVLKRVVRLR